MTAGQIPAWMSWAALGGFLGLISFIFAVWDRFVRYRPLVWIVAVPKYFDQAFPYLRVKNPGPIHIFILNLKSSSPAYRVDESETIAGAVRGMTGSAPYAMLAPGEERDFPVFPDHTKKGKSRISLSVHWRNTRWTWMRQVPKSVWTTPSDIDLLVEAAQRAAHASKDN